MNYKINVQGGGVFSKYIIAIQELSNLEFEKIYLNTLDKRTNNNIFDNIFIQNHDHTYKDINANFTYTYSNNKPIELSNKFEKYKQIINKLVFDQNLIEKVNFYKKNLQITKDTIAVHIRLTDMNIHHKSDFGYVNFEKYLNLFTKNNEYFIASDNEESLNKLINIYGNNIKYIPNLIRAKHENEDSLNLQLQNFKNKDLWQQAFMEMLLLSECSTLICRTSNLSNASIIHSNNIKNIIRV